jgi:hypothetical protein
MWDVRAPAAVWEVDVTGSDGELGPDGSPDSTKSRGERRRVFAHFDAFLPPLVCFIKDQNVKRERSSVRTGAA